jgi:hypothetical protein
MTPRSSGGASARTTALAPASWKAPREGELLPLPLSPRKSAPGSSRAWRRLSGSLMACRRGRSRRT